MRLNNAIFGLGQDNSKEMRSYEILLVLLISMLATYCTEQKEVPNEESLNVATAANMQFAMDSIGKYFYDKTGIRINVTSNSSGMLTAQIESGAPYDVFVSANMRYPNKLCKSGFGDFPVVYALGRLILVYSGDQEFEDIEQCLASDAIKRVAIADPSTAPYGIAAQEFLEGSGLKERYKDKIILGESVGQVNQYITTGAVDAAFTSYSFLTRFSDDYNFIEVNADTFTEIKQGVLILKHGQRKNNKASQAFVDFLLSDACRGILEQFGYRVK